MAERRMFAKKIIDSDAFIDMPATARLLYYDLSMRADDDGFVNNPKSILRTTGASNDDMRVLLGKRFILSFDSGVIVIKHWRINNYLRNDRYHETTYIEEKKKLKVDENGAYSEVSEDGIPGLVYQHGDTEARQGKASIGKASIGESIDGTPTANVSEEVKVKALKALSATPTLDSVIKYCEERKNGVDAKRFFNYYEARGWETNGTPIRNWKALLNTWEPKESKDPDAADKRLKELKKKRDKLVREGAGKEELEVIDLNIQSVKDAMEAHNGK